MSIRISIATLFAIAGTALSGQAAVAGFFDSALVNACEAALKRRLAVPDSYARIELQEIAVPLAGEQWAELTRETSAAVRDLTLSKIAAGRQHPQLLGVILTYDASNSQATNRYQAVCTYLAAYGDASNINEHLVGVDGLTHTDWLAAQAARL